MIKNRVKLRATSLLTVSDQPPSHQANPVIADPRPFTDLPRPSKPSGRSGGGGIPDIRGGGGVPTWRKLAKATQTASRRLTVLSSSGRSSAYSPAYSRSAGHCAAGEPRPRWTPDGQGDQVIQPFSRSLCSWRTSSTLDT